MIVIYTQDRTYIRNNADAAKKTLILVYGKSLGKEAYDAINNAPMGSTYRKNGGPLVKVVSKEEANVIRKKEIAIGMM